MLSPDDAFAAQMAEIKPEEGGYSDDPNDAGGATNWGITQNTARAFGYTGSMQAMTWDEAQIIYSKLYWVQPMLDQLCLIDDNIARKLLDAGINVGSGTANKWLQQALTDLSAGGKAFIGPNGVDGVLGGMTRASLTAFIKLRGDQGRQVLMFMLGAEQSTNYMRIEEGNTSQGEFEFGWQVRAMAPLTQPTTGSTPTDTTTS